MDNECESFNEAFSEGHLSSRRVFHQPHYTNAATTQASHYLDIASQVEFEFNDFNFGEFRQQCKLFPNSNSPTAHTKPSVDMNIGGKTTSSEKRTIDESNPLEQRTKQSSSR